MGIFDDVVSELPSGTPILVQCAGFPDLRYDQAEWVPFEFLGAPIRSMRKAMFGTASGVVIQI